MTGYGHTGAKRTQTPFDNVFQAFSGLMASTGTPETALVRVGAPVLKYGTGVQAAFATAAALTRREQTHKGQRLDVAVLDAAIVLMGSNGLQTNAKVKRLLRTGTATRQIMRMAAMPPPMVY